jgi:hypothetical protein
LLQYRFISLGDCSKLEGTRRKIKMTKTPTATKQEKKNEAPSSKLIPREIANRTPRDEPAPTTISSYEPSVTLSLFVYWILPVLVLAILSRYTQDTGLPVTPPLSRPLTLNLETQDTPAPTPRPAPAKKKVTDMPTLWKNKPTSYQEAVQKIANRRLDWPAESSDPTQDFEQGGHRRISKSPSTTPATKEEHSPASATTTTPTDSSSSLSPSPITHPPGRGRFSDPLRITSLEKIATLRDEFRVRTFGKHVTFCELEFTLTLTFCLCFNS